MFYWNLPRDTEIQLHGVPWKLWLTAVDPCFGQLRAKQNPIVFRAKNGSMVFELHWAASISIYRLRVSQSHGFPIPIQLKKIWSHGIYIIYMFIPICHGFSIPVSHGPNGFRWAVCSHFAPRPALPTSRFGGRISAAWRRSWGWVEKRQNVGQTLGFHGKNMWISLISLENAGWWVVVGGYADLVYWRLLMCRVILYYAPLWESLCPINHTAKWNMTGFWTRSFESKGGQWI
jgi:hypothetical protein